MFMKQDEDDALEVFISENITDLELHVLDQKPTSLNIYSAMDWLLMFMC